MPIKRPFGIVILLGLAAAWAGPPAAAAPEDRDAAADLAAARAAFEANLDAIRKKDREAYLAGYLDSGTLARTGPEGFELGFAAHAARAGESWPDVFEAQDLRLVPVEPGIVYGTYRYRVRYGDEEHAGLSERLFVRTRAGFKIAVTSAFDAPPGTPPPPRAFVGGTLLDGTGGPLVPGAVVLMRNGKIECAGKPAACPVPEGAGVLDVTGLFVTPGIVDAHVHFSQTGWADGRPDALDVRDRHPYEAVQARLRARPETFLKSYLCSGVTAVFDVGGYPWTWGLRAAAERDTRSPHVAAVGPLLSTRDHWLNLPGERQFVYLDAPEAARAGVRYLAAHGTDAVKVWFIVVPDRSFEEMAAAVAAAGEEAKARRLPLIVHATGLREAKAAVRAGARLLVHSVWDQPVDAEILGLMKEAGTIYCPTLTVRDGYSRMFVAAASGQAPHVDDPLGCADAETLARVAETADVGAGRVDPNTLARVERAALTQRIAAENLKAVHDAGIPVAMGTDAGNPLTLHGPSVFAEMEAMEAAGLTAMQVLAASTRGGALAMGREKEFGTVEAGKAADLLVVEADPSARIANLRRIRYVVRGGVVREQRELRAPPAAPR